MRRERDVPALYAILEDETKMVAEASGLLSRLFRLVCFRMNLKPSDWPLMAERYVKNPINGVPNDQRSINSARGNLLKQLGKDKMSVETLIRGLTALGAAKFQLSLQIEWQGGRTTNHETGWIDVENRSFKRVENEKSIQTDG